MKFINYILTILVVALTITNGRAQDIHFSQFTTAPTYINPAAAGTYGGDYRGIMNFKEQFSSFNNAYRTYKFSFDAPVLRDRQTKKVGLGIDIFQDVAGDSKTRTTEVKISGSYTANISSYSDITFGLGIGPTWYTADYSNLLWDAQFNGVDVEESLRTEEIFFKRNQVIFDFSTGAMFRYFAYDGFPYEFGFSVSHLSRPNTDIVKANVELDRLPMKFILHGKKEFEFPNYYDRYAFIPKFMFAKQRTAYEILLGGVIRYDISLHSKYTGYYKNSTIFAGLSYRYRDAVIPEVYFNYQEKYTIGVSYDVNVSQFVSASRYRGGFEVSLSMAGFFNERYKVVSPVTF